MKTEAAKLFDRTMNELVWVLEEFTPAELNEIAAPGSWTAGQVGDHLHKSYGVIHTLKGNVVLANRPVDEKIPEVKDLFLNYKIKMESSEGILPSINYIDKDNLITGIKDRIGQFQELIETEDLSLICADYAIPEYGPFTRFEWIYFTIYHTQRHLHQIAQIKEKVIA